MEISKKRKSIWTNAEGFSIVDLLAIAFSGVFLYVAVIILVNSDNIGNKLELLRTLGQPVAIILGGYFGDQIAQRFGFRQRQPYGYTPYNDYNQYDPYYQQNQYNPQMNNINVPPLGGEEQDA